MLYSFVQALVLIAALPQPIVQEPETSASIELDASGGVVTSDYSEGETPLGSPLPDALENKSLQAYRSTIISPYIDIYSAGPVEVVISIVKRSFYPRLPIIQYNAETDETVAGKYALMLNDVDSKRLNEQSDVVDYIKIAGGEVIAQYSFGNAIVARVEPYLLESIACIGEVLYIMPRYANISAADSSGIPNADDADDVAQARALLNSDQYYNNYGANLKIGLIDTGVRDTHTLLYQGPGQPENRIGLMRDCRCGGTDCENIYDPQCEYDPHESIGGTGHGTKSACIISGRNSLGDRRRGVTKAIIDSWSYHVDFFNPPTTDDLIKMVRRAIEHGDWVIAAVIQADEPYTSGLSAAYDDAYDSGAIVVAANGNWGSEEPGELPSPSCTGWPRAGSVASPANAHKVLGIGYYNVKSPSEGMTCSNLSCDNGPPNADRKRQSLGPAGDMRIKPDILMPTRSETGCALSNTCISTFCHTSGATPYAAGVALLLYNFYNANGMGPNNGKVYASLIGFGDLDYPYFSNFFGAGKVRLGDLSSSRWYIGSRYVSDGEVESFTFPVTTGLECNLKAAIWWPEDFTLNNGVLTEYHNDIDLYVVNASGNVVGQSRSTSSVFEKVDIGGDLTPGGYWTYRIVGYDVTTPGAQIVYYFLYYDLDGC